MNVSYRNKSTIPLTAASRETHITVKLRVTGGEFRLPEKSGIIMTRKEFLLLVGILAFAFPSQMLRLVIKKDKANIDGVHVCLFRCMSALTIGHALSSYAASGFTYDTDKKAHVIGRMTSQILAFAINIFAHFVTDLFTMYHVTPFMLTGFYITFLLTLYFRCNKKNVSDQQIDTQKETIKKSIKMSLDEKNQEPQEEEDGESEQDEDYDEDEAEQSEGDGADKKTD